MCKKETSIPHFPSKYFSCSNRSSFSVNSFSLSGPKLLYHITTKNILDNLSHLTKHCWINRQQYSCKQLCGTSWMISYNYIYILNDTVTLQRKLLALIKCNLNLLSNCQMKYSFCLDRIFWIPIILEILWNVWNKSNIWKVRLWSQTKPGFKSQFSTFELCHLGKVI